MPKLSRRDLLKGLGATSVTSGMFGLTAGSAQAISSVGANPVLMNKYAGKQVYHCCLRNCPDRCFLKFSVQNGRMTYVTGDETQKFKTAGTPCVKGLSYVEYTYAPDRIMHPMRRVGPKGSGKFVRITWEKAYKEIVTKWKKIIEEDGNAEGIMPYSYSGNYGTIGMYAAAERLWSALGTTKLERSWCGDAGWVGMTLTYGGSDGPDVENTKDCDCYISWGFNESATNPHGFKLINQARDKGAKLLCVNTLRTPTGSQADIFLQPYPGTDNWVAMGLIKYFLEHNHVDHDYVSKYCIGYDELVEQANSVSWDEIVKVTHLERAKIEAFAKVYADCKRPIMKIGAGIQRNLNGGSMVRAIAIFHAITGKSSCNMGIVNDNWIAMWGQNTALARAYHLRKGNQQQVNITDVWKAWEAENPTAYGKPLKQPIKSVLIYNGNPVACSANSNKVRQNLMREDLFVIGFDMIMTDSMAVCDLVLPASSQFEVSDMIGDYHWSYIQYCEKVIDPIGESKPNLYFFNELAKKMGLTNPIFDQDVDDILKLALQTDQPFFKGITLERLKKERWIHLENWCGNTGAPEGGFATPSGKVELYSEKAKKMGFNPVIDLRTSEDYMEDIERTQPFRLITPAVAQRVNSSFYNVKYIRAFNAYECQINTEDAKKLGIKTNDRVRLYNHRGEAHFVARVSEKVKPGVLMTAKCNWMATNPYGNSCTNVIGQDKLADMGNCSAFSSTRCNIAKM